MITTVIGVAMSIIGYLINRMVSKNDKEIEALKQGAKEMEGTVRVNRDAMHSELMSILKEFQAGVDGINKAVMEMNNIILTVKTQHSEQIKDLTRRVDRKEKWLESHDAILDNHSTRLTAIETKCIMKHE